MNRKELIRYIAGYVSGIAFFLILVPSMIYFISFISQLLNLQPVFENSVIKSAISLLFFIPGIVFMIWSNAMLLLKGKGGPTEGFGVEISPKTKFLVMTGPYRFTRNPMVFGAYCLYLSLAVFFNSCLSLLFVILLLPVIIIYLKKSEEKRLLKDFGEEYLKYRERVSLLIPFLWKK